MTLVSYLNVLILIICSNAMLSFLSICFCGLYAKLIDISYLTAHLDNGTVALTSSGSVPHQASSVGTQVQQQPQSSGLRSAKLARKASASSPLVTLPPGSATDDKGGIGLTDAQLVSF